MASSVAHWKLISSAGSISSRLVGFALLWFRRHTSTSTGMTDEFSSNDRKRRRSIKEDSDGDTVPTPTAGASGTDQREENSVEVLPARTFYAQLLAQFAAESPRAGASSRTAADLSSSSTLRKITDENVLPGSTSAHSAGFPEFLRVYGHVVLEQTRCLKKTCRIVMEAVRQVYQEKLDVDADLARRQMICTPEQPCTPKMPVDQVHALMNEHYTDAIQRMKAFLTKLPGFELFDQDDQKEFLSTRFMEKSTLHRASKIKNGNLLYGIGRDNIHVCTAWFRLVKSNPVDKFLALADSVNSFRFDSAETYLAFSMAFLRPGPDVNVRDQELLQFLYAHYLDAFHHLISSRSRGSPEFYSNFETVTKEFPSAFRPEMSAKPAQFRFRNSHLASES